MSKKVFAAMAMALVPFGAFAVDGVVLINQSTVMAAGGFPFIITQPGSYRLAGNLRPPLDTKAIQIGSNDVTLDLNGFAIIGSSSSGLGNNTAIVDMGGQTRIAIRNGSISGFNNGIDLRNSDHMIIEQVNVNTRVGGFAGGAITAGFNSPASAIIRGTISFGTLQVTCPALVVDNVTTQYSPVDAGFGACVSSNNVKTP